MLDHLPDKTQCKLWVALDNVVGIYVGDTDLVVPQSLKGNIDITHMMHFHATHLFFKLFTRQYFQKLYKHGSIP